MKLITIVGARPQFIKLAPLSKAIRECHEEIIIHTGQHFDNEMSDLFFKELEIPMPSYNLDVQSGSHAIQTAKMIVGLEEIFENINADKIIIIGDTNSTISGAIAAAKLNIPLIHIEAGLRSFNREMPEEINRIIADRLSDYLFAPTSTAINNLNAEGLENRSYLTGDIMVDSLDMCKNKIISNITDYCMPSDEDYYLLTIHRPYNVDNPLILEKIIKELNELDKKIIFPVHPRTRKIIEKNNIKISDKFILVKPQGYLNFIDLQQKSCKIITDSGGLQKEAYILKKPCITLRSETEWIETVANGWNLLLNPLNETNIAEKIIEFIPKETNYKNMFGHDVAKKMMKIINSED